MSEDLLLKQGKATKKGKTTNLFYPSSFLLDPSPRNARNEEKSGSDMRSGINIPDPQHWSQARDVTCSNPDAKLGTNPKCQQELVSEEVSKLKISAVQKSLPNCM
jgi:hypothetical protein